MWPLWNAADHNLCSLWRSKLQNSHIHFQGGKVANIQGFYVFMLLYNSALNSEFKPWSEGETDSKMLIFTYKCV